MKSFINTFILIFIIWFFEYSASIGNGQSNRVVNSKNFILKSQNLNRLYVGLFYGTDLEIKDVHMQYISHFNETIKKSFEYLIQFETIIGFVRKFFKLA